jgi:hypothetical protein
MTSLVATLDSTLEKIYGYHGPYDLPKQAAGAIWPLPAALLAGYTPPDEYFLHYFQSQGYGPTNNECVTTSVVMSMNMIEDRIAAGGKGPIHFIADLHLEDYVRTLDQRGISGWKYRFSTNSPLPGMMTPAGAINALNDHAAELKAKYGKSYAVQLEPGRGVDDLIGNLQACRIILIHGAWPISLSGPSNAQLALVGGMPHTMLLVGYDAGSDQWLLLNPAEPWLTQRPPMPPGRFYQMTTQKLLEFWGRKFLFYPPRFSITTIAPDG